MFLMFSSISVLQESGRHLRKSGDVAPQIRCVGPGVDFLDGENVAHVEENDELSGDLSHAGDEVGAYARAKCRRGFDFRRGDLQNLRHRIDQYADVAAALLVGDLENDDTGAPGDSGSRATESRSQVNNRHHGAAQVDDAANEG